MIDRNKNMLWHFLCPLFYISDDCIECDKYETCTLNKSRNIKKWRKDNNANLFSKDVLQLWNMPMHIKHAATNQSLICWSVYFAYKTLMKQSTASVAWVLKVVTLPSYITRRVVRSIPGQDNYLCNPRSTVLIVDVLCVR